MATESEANRQKKALMIERIYELLGTHKQILLANFTNVESNQVQLIRKQLRSYDGLLVISKNTLVKKILGMRINGIKEEEFKYLAEKYGGIIPELACLVPKMVDKIAFIFCDKNIFELKEKIEANKVPTEARVGVLSPIDFSVPAGPTGLDPSQINFFHALNISTKIVKGQIEITKDFKVCTVGKKIKASEAALLKKLNMKPFSYGMKISGVYTEGAILPKEVLAVNPTELLAKFQNGIRNIAGLSLASGCPIAATVPIIIQNSFKNIAALSIESGFKIKELDAVSSGPSEPVKAEKKKEEAKPKKAEKVEAPPAEEEEEGGMGGLFD